MFHDDNDDGGTDDGGTVVGGEDGDEVGDGNEKINEFSLWMNSETSEGKEKRVRNPEMETVVSPLGPNLVMYAESNFGGKLFCIYCAG